jgi:hypothetical protein
MRLIGWLLQASINCDREYGAYGSQGRIMNSIVIENALRLWP